MLEFSKQLQSILLIEEGCEFVSECVRVCVCACVQKTVEK